jgi:hypothetical protein
VIVHTIEPASDGLSVEEVDKPFSTHKRMVEALHTLLLRARVKNLWRLYILEVVKKK